MKTPVQSTSLFDTQERARARRHDKNSSWWAAQGIDCTARQAKVLSAFVGLETATHDQLIDRARELFGDVAESTIRTGCNELEAKGLVECLGLIGTSKRGNRCGLYRRKLRG